MTQYSAVEAQQAHDNADLIVSEDDVQKALDTMARAMAKDLADKDPILLVVMNGALFTASELAKRLTFPLQQSYLQVSRYGNETSGTELRWVARPFDNVKDRNVVVIDDIYDEGHTLSAIKEDLEEKGAKRVYSAILVEKIHDRPRVEMDLDYVGLQTKDRFLYGCGMDVFGYWRNLPAIYAIRT
jgi:hypoxanthine phosphoribosyltransferase